MRLCELLCDADWLSAFGASFGGPLWVVGGYSAIEMATPVFGLAPSVFVWLSRPRPIGDTIRIPGTTWKSGCLNTF